MVRYLLYYILIILFSSCENDDIPRVYKLKKPITLNSEEKNIAIHDEKISWDIPSDWEEIQGNSFSLAIFKILNASDYSEISITKFPGDAGGIENNVNRWRRQVGLPSEKIEKIISDADFNSNSIGKFSMHKIINEKAPESAFLCMIMPLESSTVFVKLQSTMNGVEELKKEFYRFCSSFRYLK